MPEYAGAELSDFPADVQSLASRVLSSESSLLVLAPVGTRKTRLAAAIVLESIRSGVQPTMHLVRTLFRRIWATYREGGLARRRTT